ncbi:MAG: D-alanyl-D-alanine carboxypeptidase [Hyphomicrobium sp.]
MAKLSAIAALFVGVLATGVLVVCAAGLASGRALADVKQAALVVDANTGAVLHEQFADAPRHPASLTKMMTLYMAFSEIAARRLSISSKLTVSEKAVSVAPSKLELAVGEEIELLDAIKALITKSANDMAVAIAEQIGGTEANFVRLMNERARQIGMTSTRFVNASGLPDNRQITTARDMVTLALRLQDDFPEEYKLFSLKEFEYKGKVHRTHNTLLFGFPGMDGIKTGYTRASGFNLVSSVRADGKHLVAAVFGGTTANTRNAHMRSLLFHALEKASTVKTRQSQPLLVANTEPAARPPKPAVKPVAIVKAAVVGPAIKPARQLVKSVAIAAAPKPTLKPRKDEIAAVLASDGPTTAPPPPPPASAGTSASAQSPKLDLTALREAMSRGPDEETNAAAPVPAAAALADETASARPPSTLEGQARTLSNGLASDASSLSHLNGPPPNAAEAPAVTGRVFEIQVGAFGTVEEASSKLALVRTRAEKLLAAHQSATMAVMKGDRRIFRARFVRFEEEVASSTCLELRRLAIDCFVMKAE